MCVRCWGRWKDILRVALRLAGRVGEGAGAPDVSLPTRTAEQEKATGRAEGAHSAAPAGAGGPGEEHDDPAGQEEGVPHSQASRARKVSSVGVQGL